MPNSMPLYPINGINPDTGEPLVPPVPAEAIAARAQGRKAKPEEVNQLNAVKDGEKPHLGVKYGVDLKSLKQAGWGAIFSPGSDDIQAALKTLLDYRAGADQAGALFKTYVVDPGTSTADFLEGQGVGFEPVDPNKVPYYLLIVADPETISWEFQYQLDVQYGVGRLHFEPGNLAAYKTYAASVIRAEQADFALPRRAAFFAASNPGNVTELSANGLATPLAEALEKTHAD